MYKTHRIGAENRRQGGLRNYLEVPKEENNRFVVFAKVDQQNKYGQIKVKSQ